MTSNSQTISTTKILKLKTQIQYYQDRSYLPTMTYNRPKLHNVPNKIINPIIFSFQHMTVLLTTPERRYMYVITYDNYYYPVREQWYFIGNNNGVIADYEERKSSRGSSMIVVTTCATCTT